MREAQEEHSSEGEQVGVPKQESTGQHPQARIGCLLRRWHLLAGMPHRPQKRNQVEEIDVENDNIQVVELQGLEAIVLQPGEAGQGALGSIVGVGDDEVADLHRQQHKCSHVVDEPHAFSRGHHCQPDHRHEAVDVVVALDHHNRYDLAETQRELAGVDEPQQALDCLQQCIAHRLVDLLLWVLTFRRAVQLSPLALGLLDFLLGRWGSFGAPRPALHGGKFNLLQGVVASALQQPGGLLDLLEVRESPAGIGSTLFCEFVSMIIECWGGYFGYDPPDSVVGEDSLHGAADQEQNDQADEVSPGSLTSHEIRQPVEPVEAVSIVVLVALDQGSGGEEVGRDESNGQEVHCQDEKPRHPAVEVDPALHEQHHDADEEDEPDHGRTEDLDEKYQDAQDQEYGRGHELVDLGLEVRELPGLGPDGGGDGGEGPHHQGQEHLQRRFKLVKLQLLLAVRAQIHGIVEHTLEHEHCHIEQHEQDEGDPLGGVGHHSQGLAALVGPDYVVGGGHAQCQRHQHEQEVDGREQGGPDHAVGSDEPVEHRLAEVGGQEQPGGRGGGQVIADADVVILHCIQCLGGWAIFNINNQILFYHMSLIIEDAENNFKHIHRILNTNIDGKRTVPFALETIRGVGRRFGFLICKILRINPRLRAGELNEKQCDSIANIINDPEGNGVPRWFLNRLRDYKEGKNLQMASNILETKLREDIERLYKVKANRGLRHKWGLRVRGQHTKTTGRGGATVGVERKKK